MKLATLPNGTRDGRLAIVSTDLKAAVPADDIAANLLTAMEQWERCEPLLRERAAALAAGTAKGVVPFDVKQAMAPLPRCFQWLDGSVFKTHAGLMEKAFNRPPSSPPGSPYPLMYQGASDVFYGPHDDLPTPSEELGIDFEAEFGVILSETPMGTTAADAHKYIKLIVVINDASLRALAGREMDTGFGWIQAKPASSFAPAAVTPDELGSAWSDGKVNLPLNVAWNGEWFGHPHGSEMSFNFFQLVEHAARTRKLCAGTIIGSGTVSNANYAEVGSACIAEKRAAQMLETGAITMPFMSFGDSVRIELLDAQGATICGAIEQRVIKA